jgi:hypothetical protein
MNTFKLNDSNGSMERTTFRAATVRCLKSFTRALISLAMLGTVVTLGLIFAGHHNRANAHEGCTASTIAGTYAFDLRGFRSPSYAGKPQLVGDFFPVAAAGTWSFDGEKTSSRSLVASVGGEPLTLNDSGPYIVNSNCTASATFEDGTWYMVIAADGKEIKLVNATGGRTVAAALTRQ